MGKIKDLGKNLLSGLKKSVGESIEANRKKAREQQAFNQILKKKLEITRRQAITKETIKQENKRIRAEVQAKFSRLAKKKKTHEGRTEDLLKGMPR